MFVVVVVEEVRKKEFEKGRCNRDRLNLSVKRLV